MRKSFIVTVCAMAMVWSCVDTVPECAPVREQPDPSEQTNYVAGVLNVEFTEEMAAHIEGAAAGEIEAELKEYGIRTLERMFPDAGEWEARHREAGLHRWYRLTYDPEMSCTKAASSFREVPGAAVVEIPRKMHSTAGIPFDDPYSRYMWNLYNPGTLPNAVRGADINVVPVWAITGGRKEVIVNVVDAGVNMGHPDLAGVCIPAGADGSRCFVNGHAPYTIDADLHGTHVAATIAAINNNGEGACGIAGGLDGKGGVSILVSQIFTEDDEGETDGQGDSSQGIVWGADHGALISQNSWGYTYDSEEEARDDVIPASFKAAVDYFIKNAGCDANGNQVGLMKGGIVLFAAGNDAWAYGHPADYEPVIAVGAVGPGGRRATYSNYGPWVDICAPGGDIEAFNNRNEAMICNAAGDGYYFMQGTSMACPHVSGVAALMISAYGGPGFTNDDLKDMLISGANYNFGVGEKIGPLVDAYGAYEAYGPEKAPVIVADYEGDYRIKGHEKLDVVYTVLSKNRVLDIKVEADGTAEYRVEGNKVYVTLNDGSGNHTGRHELKIAATSGSGLSSTETFKYEILENHAPEVAGPVGDQVLNLLGTTFNVKLSEVFTDQDGGDLLYTYKVLNQGVFQVSHTDDVLVFRATSDGASTITLTATDPCGKVCEYQFRAGCFDDSKGPALYPNPVLEDLHVCVGGISQTDVEIFNSTGRSVFKDSRSASVLDPFDVDMSSYAPGRYRVSVTYGGNTYQKDVVKK